MSITIQGGCSKVTHGFTTIGGEVDEMSNWVLTYTESKPPYEIVTEASVTIPIDSVEWPKKNPYGDNRHGRRKWAAEQRRLKRRIRTVLP